MVQGARGRETGRARLDRVTGETGALGFSTSRTLNHRSSDGRPTPTLTAEEAELLGIAMALRGAGRGVLQVVSDFADAEAEFAMLRRLVEKSGRPLSLSLVQVDRHPEQWRDLLAWVGDAAREGLPLKAQVCGRPVGIVLGLECTLNPFLMHPAYRQIAHLPLEEKVARLRGGELRRTLLAQRPVATRGFLADMLQNFARIFPLGDPPDYEPPAVESLAALASARGVEPAALAYDLLLERGGKGLLYLPFLNYADHSLDPSLEMMKHPDSVLGLGDGGAHLGTICDASFPTTMLTHWTRDRRRGEKLPLPWVVRAHTRHRRGGRPERSGSARAWLQGRHQLDRLRRPAVARATGRARPAGGRPPPGADGRRLPGDHRLGRGDLPRRRADRSSPRPPGARRAAAADDVRADEGDSP